LVLSSTFIILNIGAGGRSINENLICVDFQRSLKTLDINGHTKNCILSDMDELIFKDNSIDGIIALHIWEHSADPVKTLKEWVRVLKNGGRLGIVNPDFRYTWSACTDEFIYGHKWNTNIDITLYLLEKYFKELKIIKIGTFINKLSYNVVLEKTGIFKETTYPIQISGYEIDSGLNKNEPYFYHNGILHKLPSSREYEKILIFQYGKVGSTSFRASYSNSGYYPDIQETYKEKLIQTHSHKVAKDILSKYNNILIINLVRLPIDHNISAFFQNIDTLCENYNLLSINEIIQKYCELKSSWIDVTDAWMSEFFELLNIDINNFKFDKINKYNKLRYNSNDILLLRFEDFEYITSNILPKYNIHIKGKINVSSEKDTSELYKTFKKTYKINDFEKEKVINSKFTNIYYSKEEIAKHIEKYS